MGIPESDKITTEPFICKVIEAVMERGTCEYEVMDRIGKTNETKTRPIRINVNVPEKRRKLLSKARTLRNKLDYEKIYIVPELTRLQEEEDKKLRDKLKELKQNGEPNIRITKGQIIKETGGKKEVLFPLNEQN